MFGIKKRLDEVFGIQSDLPKYTYVNRSKLDERLEYLLKTQRHIVIHGASKQGKSSLRKKVLKDIQNEVIQCLPDKKIKDILLDIQRSLNPYFTSEKREGTENELSGKGSGEIEIPLTAKFGGEAGYTRKDVCEETQQRVGGFEKDVKHIKQLLEQNKRRIILEDFHYLDEETRKDMAFYLKSFFEEGIYIIIIGIWSEQNLLTYYNGDLSGRVEEIDLSWENKDLLEVLKKGEKALNIKFSDNVKTELVNSSFNNVGLLQRLAERLCFENGITESKSYFSKSLISNVAKVTPSRHKVINDIRQRYIKIYDVFSRGYEKTELEVYFNLFKAISIMPKEKLIKGIPLNDVLSNIQKFNDKIRLSDLTAALNRTERLQSSRGITPMLIMYNENLREVHLVDREFLFYKEFGNPDWEWLNN
ncbi:MAG TPA: hypothetical protein PK784_03760 [Tenuifilaceae bacterium]|nr:hypothetical protein [Tenuifilaceae bacterium]HPN20624.1 hypothetical protein [Tenuifilaceae bacterium]